MKPEQSRGIGRTLFLVMLGSMGVLLAWDAVAQFAFGLKFTVSWAIWEASIGAPVIPWLVGTVQGVFGSHLFWSGYADSQKEIGALREQLKHAQNSFDYLRTCPAGEVALICEGSIDGIQEVLDGTR